MKNIVIGYLANLILKSSICELLGNLVTRASEIWRDTAFFSGCVHDTTTACLSAIQLLLLFLDFLVRLRTVLSVFRIRKDIFAGY